MNNGIELQEDQSVRDLVRDVQDPQWLREVQDDPDECLRAMRRLETLAPLVRLPSSEEKVLRAIVIVATAAKQHECATDRARREALEALEALEEGTAPPAGRVTPDEAMPRPTAARRTMDNPFAQEAEHDDIPF